MLIIKMNKVGAEWKQRKNNLELWIHDSQKTFIISLENKLFIWNLH